MTDNSAQRLHDVFFYGLYMDPLILQQSNVQARHPRKAHVRDYQLRIGNKATLLRAPGHQAHGMVYALTHDEIDLLYGIPGMEIYAAEALLVHTGGETIAALCCNLRDPPLPDEDNPGYREQLHATMEHLGLPIEK